MTSAIDSIDDVSKPIPRTCFQRAFVRWFQENCSRFAVPVRLASVTAKGVRLNFPNHPDCIFVWLNHMGLSVCVDWDGTCWDMLISLDVSEKAVPGGYRCELCEDANSSWLTLEALWQNHLYEPFLSWVNNELAPAHRLMIFGDHLTVSWATLCNEKTNSLPLENLVAKVSFILPPQ